MLINNVDIKKYNATQLSVDFATSVSNSSEWQDNVILPYMFESKFKYNSINIDLIFKGNNRDEILKNISCFLMSMKKPFELKIDGYADNYKCYLFNYSSTKSVNDKKYKVTINLYGYQYTDEKVKEFNKTSQVAIMVGGNTETPAIIEITPTIDFVDLTLTGLSLSPIKINNLHSGKKIILNGEDCTVLEDGTGNKFRDTEMWEFPYLKVGTNNITADKNSCNITIKYKERWI